VSLQPLLDALHALPERLYVRFHVAPQRGDVSIDRDAGDGRVTNELRGRGALSLARRSHPRPHLVREAHSCLVHRPSIKSKTEPFHGRWYRSLPDISRGEPEQRSGRFAPTMPDPRSIQHRTLGQLIRARRDALGISQEDLAHEAALDRSHLGAIERGEGNPAYGSLLAIAEALRLRLSQLQTAVETISDVPPS